MRIIIQIDRDISVKRGNCDKNSFEKEGAQCGRNKYAMRNK